METTEYGTIRDPSNGLDRVVSQPLIHGYMAPFRDRIQNLNASAGGNTLTGATVPNGQIWFLEQVSAQNKNNTPTRIIVFVTASTYGFTLLDRPGRGADLWEAWTGLLTMAPGDHVDAFINGCVAGDDLYLTYCGRIVYILP